MSKQTVLVGVLPSNAATGAGKPQPFPRQLFIDVKVSIVATLLLAVLVCGIYPLIVWGLAHVFFPGKASGSLIGADGAPTSDNGQVVGSALIGQSFADPKYFHPRPSAAGNGYDPTASGGSNLGPTSAKLFNGTIKKDDKGAEIVDFDGLRLRVIHYCVENNLPFESSVPIAQFMDNHGNLEDVKLIKSFNSDHPFTFTPAVSIPADAVTASGSGLDPHITPANALLQLPRVAKARGVDPARVQQLLDSCTEGPDLGFLGERRINVLRLNLALDRAASKPAAQASPARSQ